MSFAQFIPVEKIARIVVDGDRSSYGRLPKKTHTVEPGFLNRVFRKADAVFEKFRPEEDKDSILSAEAYMKFIGLDSQQTGIVRAALRTAVAEYVERTTASAEKGKKPVFEYHDRFSLGFHVNGAPLDQKGSDIMLLRILFMANLERQRLQVPHLLMTHRSSHLTRSSTHRALTPDSRF